MTLDLAEHQGENTLSLRTQGALAKCSDSVGAGDLPRGTDGPHRHSASASSTLRSPSYLPEPVRWASAERTPEYLRPEATQVHFRSPYVSMHVEKNIKSSCISPPHTNFTLIRLS